LGTERLLVELSLVSPLNQHRKEGSPRLDLLLNRYIIKPKCCHGYDACFSIGYDDGYSDAKSRISPAYASVGHSQSWCNGYNSGFRAGNGSSVIYDGPNTEQKAGVESMIMNSKL